MTDPTREPSVDTLAEQLRELEIPARISPDQRFAIDIPLGEQSTVVIIDPEACELFDRTCHRILGIGGIGTTEVRPEVLAMIAHENACDAPGGWIVQEYNDANVVAYNTVIAIPHTSAQLKDVLDQVARAIVRLYRLVKAER